MMLRQLLWDVHLVVFLKIVDAPIVLNHFNVHVGDAQAKDYVLVVRISDFRYRIVENVVTNLVIKVIVGLLVQRYQVGKFRDLLKESWDLV